VLAFAAFVLGTGLAWVLYKGKKHDPIHIPLLANKFYFDEIYAFLIRWTHDRLATISAAFDRWGLDMGVRGASSGTWCTGFALRFLQVGNLQGYAFLFGLGVVALMYFVIFQ
jgi:NADH-quinone oxidoreductase subunit L